MSRYVVIGENSFSLQLAKELEAQFIRINSTIFPDSELKTQIGVEALQNIGDMTALVVIRAKRYSPNPNDCVLKTILVADTLTKYGVDKKHLLLPYMFYARQDGERQPGESNSLSKIADLYEDLGFETLLTVNSHLYGKKRHLQKFFNKLKIFDISCTSIFADYLKTQDLKNPFIVGPGKGPEKMASELSHFLDCDYECLPKTRNPETGRVDMDPPKSDFTNKDVIIYDDIASSGGTTEMAYRLSEARNPQSLTIALTHFWTRSGIRRLSVLGGREVITTNSFETEQVNPPFTELSLVPLIADKIMEMSSEIHTPLRKGFNATLHRILSRRK